MNSSTFSSRRPSKTTGSALVITLAVLVLMSIMVISLSDIMRVERGSAYSHLEKERAEMLAELGTSVVTARLRKETGDTTRNWISEPGQIVASTPSGGSNKLIDPPIPLSSGAPETVKANYAQAYLRPAELNVPTFDTVTTDTVPPHLISNQEDPNQPGQGKAVSMAVRWVYVRKDGTEDPAELPDLTNKINPVVGRYAYWTDDESCKVNYNLAWTRSLDNPNPPSHPTKINLPTLFSEDANSEAKAKTLHFFDPTGKQTVPAVVSNVSVYRGFSRFFFHTPENARQAAQTGNGVDSTMLSDLLKAKFSVTHYNQDPDTTFFNEPRIVLTTQPALAGWTKVKGTSTWVGTNGLPWIRGQYDPTRTGTPIFLNIASLDASGNPLTNLWDPMAVVPATGRTQVDPDQLADVINRINLYLKRTDWPIASTNNTSFQAKYYSGYTPPADAERLTQIALNIINYVRSKECAGDPVTGAMVPIRGEKKVGQNFVMMDVATSVDSYIGITRSPKITEMGMWVSNTPSKITPDPTAPTDSTRSTYDYPAKAKIEVYLPPNFGLAQIDLTKLTWYTSWTSVNSSTVIAAAPGDATIKAGGASSEVLKPDLTPAANGILVAGAYAYISRPVTVSFKGPRPANPSDIALRFAISLAHRLDVAPLGDAAPCTIDAPNVTEQNMSSIEVDDPRVNTYKGDWQRATHNSFGLVNGVSSIGKPPGGYVPKQDVNGAGVITDVSLVMPAPPGTTGTTLSANPTGVMGSSGELGYIHTGMESMAKAGVPWRTLHLQPDSTQALPDWAFMDLFTVPVDVPIDPTTGLPDTHVQAVYSPHGNTKAGRVNMNAKPEPFDIDRQDPLVAVFENATYDATHLTQRLTHDQAVTIAKAVYSRNQWSTKGKAYGYADGYDSPGEVVEVKGVAEGGEESEQLVREIANLITARGGAFSIYTVGQAVKQTPNQTLIVTGEQRSQTMVERYSDKTGIHFKPVFFRSLTP